MCSSISHVTQAQPPESTARTSTQKPASPQKESAPQADSVQLSPTAQALLAAQHEAQ